MTDMLSIEEIRKLDSDFRTVNHNQEMNYHIAQVDSIQYPPDVNHSSMRLNSTIAYIYSDKIRTGHHARKLKDFIAAAPRIAATAIALHEEIEIVYKPGFSKIIDYVQPRAAQWDIKNLGKDCHDVIIDRCTKLEEENARLRKALTEIAEANFWRSSRVVETAEEMINIAQKALKESTK